MSRPTQVERFPDDLPASFDRMREYIRRAIYVMRVDHPERGYFPPIHPTLSESAMQAEAAWILSRMEDALTIEKN